MSQTLQEKIKQLVELINILTRGSIARTLSDNHKRWISVRIKQLLSDPAVEKEIEEDMENLAEWDAFDEDEDDEELDA